MSIVVNAKLKRHPKCEYCAAAERVMNINQQTMQKAVAKIRKLEAENHGLKRMLLEHMGLSDEDIKSLI